MGVRTALAACAAAMACACAASADAGVIFSSMPGMGAAPLGDWDATFPYTVAGSFSLASAQIVGSVDYITDTSTDPTYVDIAIFANDGGQLGEVKSNDGIGGANLTYHSIGRGMNLFSATLNNGVPLAPGDYWLRITGYSTGIIGFAVSGSTLQCSDSVTGCTPIDQTMGFDLLSGSYGVPEPATWAVMLVGLFLLGGALRTSARGSVGLSSSPCCPRSIP